MEATEPSKWTAEQLRVTCFTSDQVGEGQVSWWSAITNSQPESSTARPALGTYTAQGPFMEGQLTLAISPGRIDWVLSGRQSEEFPVASLDSLSASREAFVGMLKIWLEKHKPTANRLAFGLIANRRVQHRREGYETLASLLPAVKIDAERSSDFFYQINRPRHSKTIDGLLLNRLSKWAVAEIAFLPIGANAQAVTFYACRSEIDINSDKDRVDGLGTKSPYLLEELGAMAVEILEGGDVP
jgi:hypothetical protein